MEGSPRSSMNKTQQSSAKTLAKEEDEMTIFQEAIVFNEQPFRIEGDKLKELIHRSVGGLTFLNRYRQIKAGSGVLISRDTVLTSAHNIYDPACNAENSGFKFYLGANGVGEEYHQFDGWRYPEEFKTCPSSSKLPFDYAIMKLKRPIEFKQFLPLSLPCQQCLLKENERTMLKVFGFPCAYPDGHSFEKNFKALDEYGEKIRLYQYGLARKGRIVVVDSSKSKIGYGISTLPGQSGCPVIAEDSIIAVHVGGDKAQFNVGRMADANFITEVLKWGEQLGSAKFQIKQKNVCPHMQQVLEDKKQIFNKTSSPNPAKTNPQTKLQLRKQGLKSVDLSEYANLLQLDLRDNSLEAIDLSHCPLLQKLKLQYNQLRSVDTKANINLTYLQLNSNQLSAIDVSTNINLTYLDLSSNKLSAMDVSNNINLTQLHLSSNQLSAIDVSKNINLTQLNLYLNQLSAMDVSKNINLTWLDLSSNKLSATDVSSNINLTHLVLSSNKLSAMDVSNNIKLTILNLSSNQLSAMDVSSNINLTHLQLSSNQLSAMDVSSNINLTSLFLSSNQLSAINLSANSNLQYLFLKQNKIAEIDLSRNTKLRLLQIQENRLVRISLAVAGNVPADKYTGSFILSDQQSAACRVELRCEESDREKAAGIAGEMRKRYAQKQNNKHACAYSFQVL